MDTKQTDTNSTTELARVRTREAADRTLMAWIRTSLSLIGFGFTANKVLGVLEAGKSASPLHSTLVFALSFIALGTFGLLGAVIQYSGMLKHLQVRTFMYLNASNKKLRNRRCLRRHGLRQLFRKFNVEAFSSQKPHWSGCNPARCHRSIYIHCCCCAINNKEMEVRLRTPSHTGSSDVLSVVSLAHFSPKN